jgi:hypothetical protein
MLKVIKYAENAWDLRKELARRNIIEAAAFVGVLECPGKDGTQYQQGT